MNYETCLKTIKNYCERYEFNYFDAVDLFDYAISQGDMFSALDFILDYILNA